MPTAHSKQQVHDELIEVFAKHAQTKAPVTEQSHITADLGIDSLAVMEIVAELEERYDLTFPDEDLPAVKTVGDVIATVHRHLLSDGRLS